MAYILNKFKDFYYESDSYRFFPETYLIPEQMELYKKTHKVVNGIILQKHKERIYICKTNRGSQGTGIKMIFSPKDVLSSKGIQIDEPEKVVQRYVKKPLLIGGLKHDLRLYLLIANVDPLVAFLNEEGLARFCTDEYEEPTQDNKSKSKMVHLTNFSLNKSSPNFVHTDELTEINSGSKQTLSSYWKALEKEGIDVAKVKKDIVRLNQELLKAMKPYLSYFQKCTFPRCEPGKYFHVIGVDIILDSQLRPWILEINASPSLNVDSTIKESKLSAEEKMTMISNNPFKYKLPEHRNKYVVSAVDLHVKTM